MRLKNKNKSSFLVKLLLIVSLFLGGVFFYMSPWGQVVRSYTKTAWDYVVDKADWRVDPQKNVWILGHKRTDKDDVMKALNIQINQKMNTIDLDEKRQALEKLPWVKKAIIERKLPNQLKIEIFEKTPIARWQNKGQYYLLDEEGQPVQDKQYLTEDLILVVGPDAPQHILKLLSALDKVPDILSRVRSAQRGDEGRNELHFHTQIIVQDAYHRPPNEFGVLDDACMFKHHPHFLFKEIHPIHLRLKDCPDIQRCG